MPIRGGPRTGREKNGADAPRPAGASRIGGLRLPHFLATLAGMTHAFLLLALACASDPTAALPDAEAAEVRVHVFA
jgi:hypothetical protein